MTSDCDKRFVFFVCQSLVLICVLTLIVFGCLFLRWKCSFLVSVDLNGWLIDSNRMTDGMVAELSKYKREIKARTHVNRLISPKKFPLCVREGVGEEKNQDELGVAHCIRSSQFNFDVQRRRLPSIGPMYVSYPHLSLIVISGNISRWHVYTFVWLVLSVLPRSCRRLRRRFLLFSFAVMLYILSDIW